MDNNTTNIPKMDWDAPDLSETFAMFKQQMQLYFSVRNIDADKQLDTVLLSIGIQGLKLYNSWSLEAADKTIDNVCKKFEQHFEPQTNFWLARLHLQRLKQRPDEKMDCFIARIRLQALKCSTRDTIEFDQRVIETIIAGVKYDIVQRDLLSKPKTLSLADAVQHCRNYEVATQQLQELKDVQSKTSETTQEVDAIRTRSQQKQQSQPPSRKCDYCGRAHPRQAPCPARGSVCSNCAKMDHWAAVCRSTPPPQQQQQPRQQRENEQLPNNVHTVLESPSHADDIDNNMIYSNINIATNSTPRDNAMTEIKVQIPTKPHAPTSMRIMVDTGAQGNVLPLRVFRVMLPDYMDINKPKVSVLQPCNDTVLTAYNGTNFPHYGTLTLNCRKDINQKWSPHKFYIADTPGPIILGLPSCQSLSLVTLHCAMESIHKPPVMNTEQLVNMYPSSFDTLGNFRGDYHIDAQPIVHAQRKCPVTLRSEIQHNAIPSQPHEPLLQHDTPDRAWQMLGTDLFHWNNHDYLIVVDYYSKFTYIRKLQSTTCIVITETLKQMFSETGIPQRLNSYTGPQYTGAPFQQFVNDWGIEHVQHVTSSPRYPMSKGMVERAVRTVKNTLDKARRSGIDPHLAMLNVRATPISDNLPSPAELLLGRKLQTNLPSYTNPHPDHESTRKLLRERQCSQAHYHDKHAHALPLLSRGGLVKVQNPATHRWDRAFVVAKCANPRSYIIQTESGAQYRRNRRHIRLRQPDPLPIEPQRDNECAPQQPDVQKRTSGRACKPPLRYTNWT